MTVRTLFRTSERLLIERRLLHELMDPLWMDGDLTRQEVYEQLRTLLGSEVAVHVSDLGHEEMEKAAAWFARLFEKKTGAHCSSCVHADGRDCLGVAVCGKTGRPLYRNYNALNKECNYESKATSLQAVCHCDDCRQAGHAARGCEEVQGRGHDPDHRTRAGVA